MTRKRADWDAIEPHYRAGIRALKDIASEFDVSDAAIVKHARKMGWTRNLKAKIQAKADAKVSAALVSAEVSAAKTLTESVRVEIEAEVQARIRLAHRADITRMRTLVLRLLAECEEQSEDPASFVALGELLRASDERGMDKLNEAYTRVIGLPQRIKGVKELAETLRILVTMEREAYNINGDDKPGGGFEQLLRELHEAAHA
jgi:hypothetical protein